MATHSSILVWRIHRQRSLAGYSPWGRKESYVTEYVHVDNGQEPKCFCFPIQSLSSLDIQETLSVCLHLYSSFCQCYLPLPLLFTDKTCPLSLVNQILPCFRRASCLSTLLCTLRATDVHATLSHRTFPIVYHTEYKGKLFKIQINCIKFLYLLKVVREVCTKFRGQV